MASTPPQPVSEPPQQQSQAAVNTTSGAGITTTSSSIQSVPDGPTMSVDDDGLSRRPRDARLIHLILSSLGIHSYQERVPLQLLDFAYRYTSGVLSDSLRLSSEGYTSGAQPPSGTGTGSSKKASTVATSSDSSDGSQITVAALRQAIASRQDYSFTGPHLPKEFMLEQASERNRIALPGVSRSWGLQLPPEKYCLTGTSWSLKDEWESEGEEEDQDQEQAGGDENRNGTVKKERSSTAEDKGNIDMKDGDRNEDEEEEGGGSYEDVFGRDGAADDAGPAGPDGDGAKNADGDGDHKMADG